MVDITLRTIFFERVEELFNDLLSNHAIYVKNPNGSLYELQKGFEFHVYPSNVNNKED